MKPPFPPPPQLGVEVNLGNSNNGMDDIQPDKPQEIATSKPQTAQKVDHVATQSTDETINLNNKKVKKTEVKPKVEEKPTEPVINNKYIWNSDKNNSNNSQGSTNKPGDNGMENGDPNAQNSVGDGGHGGVTFSLKGRRAKSLPKPKTGFNEEGKVKVKVWVNKYGKVTNAIVSYEGGTTTTNSVLKKRAIEAALKSQFDSKPDAPEVQTGTITYVFVLK